MDNRETSIGVEEGETCNRAGCTGKLEYVRQGDCTCHISTPCAACLSMKLSCPECGWEEGL